MLIANDPGTGGARLAGGARNPRDARIDALRGLAISLIVVQHLGWAFLNYRSGPGLAPTFAGTWADLSKLGTFWYLMLTLSAPFCVNAFALVSGYLLAASSARSFGVFARGRFLTLMIPFVAWVVVYWVDPQTALFFVNKGGLPRFVAAALFNPTGGVAGPVWFLPPLFFSSLIVYGVNRVRPAGLALAVCLAASLVLPRAITWLGVGSPFGLIETSMILPFVAAGALLRGRGPLRWRADWRRLTAAVVLYAGCWYLRAGLAGPIARVPRPWNAPLSFARTEVPGFLLSMVGIWMCFELVAMLPERGIAPPAWLGAHSLGVCGAQLPAIALLVSLGMRSPWVVFPATLALTAGLSWLLDRNKVTRALWLGGRSAAPRLAEATAADHPTG